ncbi:MAG: methylated-DNA--[protein]-cysteine S-methyltransferase [Vicinamibacterales bacterium]|nr:methylated-DNA--[protein]-cysteine S-methyltransferase [Vicinamibacterales bacterium]
MSSRIAMHPLSTPLGEILAAVSDTGLCALEYPRSERRRLLDARLRRWFPEAEVVEGATAAHEPIAAWLERYFAGDAPPHDAVALDLRGTPFERSVWRELLRIRDGRTETYGALARRLGRPTGARAVGLAVGRNPASIIVPCHRVVGASGALTGYGGGLDRKRWLLAHEGVAFGAAPQRLAFDARG